MPFAVHVIWWITIGLALVLTVVATHYLLAVIRTCGQIVDLANRTAPAAAGIARHTSAIAGLGAVIQLAPTLLRVAGEIDGSAGTISSTLDAVAPKENA